MNEYEEIDLLELLKVIVKRKFMIICITLFITISAIILSMLLIKPVYETKASIVQVKEEARLFYEDKYNYSDVMMYESLSKTYVEIAMSDTVMQKTADNLEEYKKQNIKNMISVGQKGKTQIIEIKVKGEDKFDVAKIANEHIKNFISESNIVLPASELYILDKAQIPRTPISPNILLNGAIAFVLGLMISLFLVFIIEYLDTKIRTEKNIEDYLNIPVLISIPNIKE